MAKKFNLSVPDGLAEKIEARREYSRQPVSPLSRGRD